MALALSAQTLSRFLPTMLCSLTLTLALAGQSSGIMLGQVDDFEGLSTSGWKLTIDIENPSVISDGGPAGAGDAFLRYEAFGGSGPGSRRAIYNTTQWTGDYAAAGVTGILLDAIALAGAEPIQLRLAIGSSENAQSGSWFVSTNPMTLTPGEGWRSIFLPLDEASLTQVSGALDHKELIKQVGALRILSSIAASNRGDALAGVFGLDNLQAVPEPTAATCAGVAAAALIAGRRSRRTR